MPSSTSPPEVVYRERHAHLTQQAATLRTSASRLRLILTLSTAVALLAVAAAFRADLPLWPVLIPAAPAAFSLLRLLKLRREQLRIDRLLALYNQAIGRIDGSAPQTGHTGDTFHNPTHLYERDLAILGHDSLFGLLATVRTGVGQAGLAQDLLHAPSRDETLARQLAIQELAPRMDLREAIHLLGVSDFQQVPAIFFDAWLNDPPPAFHPALRVSLVATTVGYLLLTLAGILHLAPWSILRPNILLFLALQSVLALAVRKRVVPLLDASSGLANQMRMFRDGLALLQANAFTSPHLRVLQTKTRQPANALHLITRIERQFIIVEQRTKNIALVLSLFLAAGTHAALSIAAWKRHHAAAMKQWLAAWAEFESLNALATYAFEHPANIYPEILPTGTAIFEATALAHPLLPSAAISNDLALDGRTSLLLISGSNMAGKSTLLRAIGCNAVLAAAGAPIRATAARLSPLTLGVSIALTDSLAEGKSKFLAEVERLHAILELAAGPIPVLFLIDEVFAGTNSADRRIAAEAVARTLIARRSIGALSTHDLTLTDMATDPHLRVANVHMASPDPADPLAFDYLLQPGINPTTNALAILRLIGVGIDLDLPATTAPEATAAPYPDAPAPQSADTR